MLYYNPEFILLLVLCLGAYALAPSQRWRFAALLAASAVFYAWAGLFDCLIFGFVILLSWGAAALGELFPAHRKALSRAGIVIIVGHLLFWKYAPWIVGQIQTLSPGFYGGRELFLPLPIGISFYTFQSIAYLVDYSRGDAPFVGLSTYALFKGFFAQLVAGPIVRGRQLLPQLKSLERPKVRELSAGLALFALGFFKKIAVADHMAYYVDTVFASPERYGRLVLLKAVLGYTVQIWADFSGYTDMGRGAALMFGIRLPENFRSPYLSRTPMEFWRRWHITLSEWIRDYLYIPLGGSRGSWPRKLAVVIVTMALSGFWHGANWTFMFWGLYHGALLATERYASLGWTRLRGRALDALRWSLTMPAVIVGWALFRCQSAAAFWAFMKGLALGTGAGAIGGQGRAIYFGIAFCAAFQLVSYYDLGAAEYAFLKKPKQAWDGFVARRGLPAGLAPAAGACAGALLALGLVGTILLRSSHGKDFIYFQF